MPGIETRTDASPARPDELVLAQAVLPGLVKTERPTRKFDWNPRSSRHDP
jgi:hypothetical protein